MIPPVFSHETLESELSDGGDGGGRREQSDTDERDENRDYLSSTMTKAAGPSVS